MTTTKYQITVNLPTAKEFVEVSGLGLFRNGETTQLEDEQVELFLSRPRSGGGEPLSYFPEGITVEEVPTATKPKTASKSKATDKVADKPTDKTDDDDKTTTTEDKPADVETKATEGTGEGDAQ